MFEKDTKVLIFYNRHDLIMFSILKIINSTLKVKSEIVRHSEDTCKKIVNNPELIIFDQTIIMDDNLNIIQDYNNRFPDTKIIIITIDDDWRLKEEVRKNSNVEVLNLWKYNPSLSKSLMLAINSKLVA